jgi:hypothetical protein
VSKNTQRTINQMKRAIRTKISVPVFDADVLLVVDPDILKARERYDDFFEAPTAVKFETAWCEYSLRTGRFGLFFPSRMFDSRTIVHESFHLSYRILQWACAQNHETGALLTEWLFAEVSKIARRHGYR